MAYITNPAERDRMRPWRRYLFPLTILLVCGGAFAFPFAWRALGHDTDPAIWAFMAMVWLAPPIGIFLLTTWWLFFSGVRWWLRLGALIIPLVGIPAAWLLTVRDHEYTTTDHGLVPRVHFVWEKTAQEQLNELQKQPVTLIELPPIDATVGPEDFARFRGPRFDGVVTHLKLETDWDRYKPTLLWERPCVGGYSGIAVAGNIAVTIELREGQEVVVCYNCASGRQRWTYAYDANYVDKMRMGDGPRSTPTIHDGLIFTCGAMGDLVCLNAQGQKQWSINVLKEAKAKNITWGLTGSPLIVDDLVIAHAGIDPEAPAGAALLAFEYKTGKKRWATGNHKAGYSSPQLAVLDKVPQILLFDAGGLYSYDPKTGSEFWDIPWETKMDMNMIQPVIVGNDRVFISSEATNGCGLFQIIAPSRRAANWRVLPVWQNKNLGARFANPVTDGKHIFGLQNITGVVRCLNVDDGTIRWTGERYGPGQMLLVEDVLLIVSDQGTVSLLKTDSGSAEVLASFQVFDDKTWNTPALAGDQLFLRNQFKIACLKLPRRP